MDLMSVVGKIAEQNTQSTELAAQMTGVEQNSDDNLVEAAMSGTFLAIVSAAVTLLVGIYVFAEISDTMPTPENAELANATSNVKSTTGSAFQLAAVAIIVLVAGLILSLVGGFGQSSQGGRR